MKPFSRFLLVLLLVLISNILAAQNLPIGEHLITEAAALPLVFEANEGQADDSVQFMANGAYATSLKGNGIVVILPASDADHVPLTIEFVGASKSVRVDALGLLPGRSNYYAGNDPKKWHVNIHQYEKVQYTGLYPGVDAVFYGTRGQLEFDLRLSPHTDTDQIRLATRGAKKLEIDLAGNLHITTNSASIRLLHPAVYQELRGVRTAIEGKFELLADDQVGFKVEKHERDSSLVIDPVLSYATPLPNTTGQVSGVAADSSGNSYLAGQFYTNNGMSAAFITKLSSSGTQILYTTYLGGNAQDFADSVAVDSLGNAYVTGAAGSDLPVTQGAFMTTCPTGPCFETAFAAKLLSNGALSYATYTGSSLSVGKSIAVDNAGDAYLTGLTESNDLPVVNAYQPTFAGILCAGCTNAFVQKLNATGTSMYYSSYFSGVGLGGGAATMGDGIAVDSSGSAYVVGPTTGIPLKNALQLGPGSSFLAKFSPDGSALVYSTYFGDLATNTTSMVAVDSAGNVHVAGTTGSCSFPLTLTAFNTLCGAPYDVFLSVINSTGNQVVFSTFLGQGTATGIALDTSGNSYVTGITNSDSFPVLNGIEAASQSTVNFSGGWKSFVSKLDPSGKLLFSTYFEGEAGSESMAIAVDSKKRIYIAGLSGGGDFPILHPIPSQTYAPCCGYFAARITPSNTPQLSLAPRSSPTLTLRNVSSVPLLISSIVATSNFTQGGDCSSTIAAGQGCTLILSGAADGKASGSVSITSNASPATQTFKILKSKTGDTVGAVVIINPASLTYPAQLVSYASAVQPVRVRNVGLQPSTLNSIVISGDFTQTNDCPAVLSPATFCTISVVYKPSAAGQSSGSLDITHDSTDDSVYLSGTGSSSAIALSTPVLNFGNQWVGASPLARVINLTNTTPYPASVTGISTTTGFSETDTCTTPLSPQSSCRAAVTFNPGTNVNALGTLTANTYGPGGAQSVNLSGTGLIAADLAVNPLALSFPQAFLNTKMGPQNVTVTNTTGAGISVTSVQTAAPFSQTNNCVGTLAAA
jgi:Beta-propeller repeat